MNQPAEMLMPTFRDGIFKYHSNSKESFTSHGPLATSSIAPQPLQKWAGFKPGGNLADHWLKQGIFGPPDPPHR